MSNTAAPSDPLLGAHHVARVQDEALIGRDGIRQLSAVCVEFPREHEVARARAHQNSFMESLIPITRIEVHHAW
jgi:hypothetical protein